MLSALPCFDILALLRHTLQLHCNETSHEDTEKGKIISTLLKLTIFRLSYKSKSWDYFTNHGEYIIAGTGFLFSVVNIGQLSLGKNFEVS